ncbi:hypothetical protein N7493_007373 [Penicillium malachiteum]|uniref:ASST-domain-containing protein n=1 Tax=Penicillium malachiteum TaxID=1324776 RepID=A0AAD6HJB8_9EURO|nr:hypothetical protein N7493_007373 [Penicillium malachiteum]
MRLLLGLFVVVTAIASLHYLLIGVLLRLNLQVGVSLFDHGLYGLYPTRQYVSFNMESPDVELAVWDDRCSDGYIFIAPHGSPIEGSNPVILDKFGNLVWTMPVDRPATDFNVQEYLGEKYLTYWHGESDHGHGLGSYAMLDSHYIHRFEVTPVGHFEGDIHDFHISEDGTALIVIYDLKQANLLEFDGPNHGFIYDGVFQEVDIATGELIFEWHFSDHVPFSASYTPELKGSGKDSTFPWDPYHINSVDKDDSGNYIVSARHTHSVYNIDSTTGEILWILGGKGNQFTDASNGRATDFAWQHDARWHDQGTLTLYDNAAKDFLGPITRSRGMIIDLDVPNRVAAVRQQYFHPDGIRAHSQGNMQLLPNSGNPFVGWGHCAAYTEFSPAGEVLCDTHLSASNWFQLGLVVSYRTYKSDWIGRPLTIPMAVVVEDSVFVSWNGATEIAAWRLELWDGVDMNDMQFEPTKSVEKIDFETKVDLPDEIPNTYFRLVAVDSKDNVLGRTALLSKHPRQALSEWLGIAVFGELSWPVVVTILALFCCCLLAVYGVVKAMIPTARRLFSYFNVGRRLGFERVTLSTEEDEEEDVPLMTHRHGD